MSELSSHDALSGRSTGEYACVALTTAGAAMTEWAGTGTRMADVCHFSSAQENTPMPLAVMRST